MIDEWKLSDCAFCLFVCLFVMHHTIGWVVNACVYGEPCIVLPLKPF